MAAIRIIKTAAIAFCVVAVLAAAFCAFVNYSVAQLGSEYILESDGELVESELDAVLLISSEVTDGLNPIVVMSQRIEEAARLYKLGAADRVIVAGEQGPQAYNETYLLKLALVGEDVPSQDVTVDSENCDYLTMLKKLRDEYGCERIAVVTDRGDIFRVLYAANRLGITAYSSWSDYYSVREDYFSIVEMIERLKAFLYVNFD